MNELPASFYQSHDVVEIARQLLGKYIHKVDDEGVEFILKIVETEAYRAPEDKASHAYNNRRTKRTSTMYLNGGHWYVYLCYGIHHLLNVVTAEEDIAHAVLIRAVEPIQAPSNPNMKINTNGPGKFTKAFSIDRSYNNLPINKAAGLYITEGESISSVDIVSSTRIGIDYAEEWANMPWRFYLRNNAFVSKL